MLLRRHNTKSCAISVCRGGNNIVTDNFLFGLLKHKPLMMISAMH